MTGYILESRCRVCDCPQVDHQPLRYVLRVHVRHAFWNLIGKLAR